MKQFLPIALLILSASAAAQNFNIGHRQLTWIDSSRNNRPVKFEVYYPAASAGDDVPIINNGRKFPLAVFGHGYQLTYTDYVWLRDSLVPRGYFLAFPRTEEQLFPSHTDFAKDFAFLVNEFDKNKNNQAAWFFNRLNSRYAVSGHSMGGGCSMLSVQYSSKITAVFNLAAAETNPSAIAAAATIRIPSLLFGGSRDCVTPPSSNQLPIYANVQPVCKTYVEITRAQHCQWANNSGTCTLGQLFCGGGATAVKPVLSSTFSLLLPWLNAALYNNNSEAARFQAALRSATGITYQQACSFLQNTAIAAAQPGLKLYPSVVKPGQVITLALPIVEKEAYLQISDQQGRVVYTTRLQAGESSAKISTGSLRTGVHFVIVRQGSNLLKSSFMVQ